MKMIIASTKRMENSRETLKNYIHEYTHDADAVVFACSCYVFAISHI